MVVKMTNREMVTAANRIANMQKREEERGDKLFGVNVKLIYAIKKNKDKLLRLLKPYDEAREELEDQYLMPEVRKDGSRVIKDGCKEKWDKEIEALLEIEVDVDVHTVKFAEIDGLALSVNDLEAIDFMLEAPEGFAD